MKPFPIDDLFDRMAEKHNCEFCRCDDTDDEMDGEINEQPEDNFVEVAQRMIDDLEEGEWLLGWGGTIIQKFFFDYY